MIPSPASGFSVQWTFVTFLRIALPIVVLSFQGAENWWVSAVQFHSKIDFMTQVLAAAVEGFLFCDLWKLGHLLPMVLTSAANPGPAAGHPQPSAPGQSAANGAGPASRLVERCVVKDGGSFGR